MGNEVALRFGSNVTGAESNLVKKRGRGRLRRGVELCMQDVYADLVVAQRCCSLTALYMAAHYDAVRILTAWIMTQQAPGMAQTCAVIAHTIALIRQIPKQA